jgi:hypothetical protein
MADFPFVCFINERTSSPLWLSEKRCVNKGGPMKERETFGIYVLFAFFDLLISYSFSFA